MSQAFGNSGLTNSRFPYQHRVIFGTAGKNLEHTADFIVTADDWIQFATMGELGQVFRILIERIISILSRSRGYTFALAEFSDDLFKFFFGNALFLKGLAYLVFDFEDRQEQMFYRDILIVHLLSDIACFGEYLASGAGEGHLSALYFRVRS